MTLTQEQYDQLLSNYAESLVDGMDMDSLVQFAIEQIAIDLLGKLLVSHGWLFAYTIGTLSGAQLLLLSSV